MPSPRKLLLLWLLIRLTSPQKDRRITQEARIVVPVARVTRDITHMLVTRLKSDAPALLGGGTHSTLKQLVLLGFAVRWHAQCPHLVMSGTQKEALVP